jgi:hypothetical protein
MSAKGMADHLGEKLPVVSYHMRRILDRQCQLIEETRNRPRRGSIEHFYRVKPQGMLGHPDWQDVVPEVFVSDLKSDALRGLVETLLRPSGVVGRKSFCDEFVGWVRLEVDRGSRKQIDLILRRAYEEVIDVAEEGRSHSSPGQREPLIVGIASVVEDGSDNGVENGLRDHD